MLNKKLAILFFFSLFISSKIFAQENSPYTRYGLGDFKPQTSTGISAMGGLTATYNDGLKLNFTNPASYASLKLTTFDVGFYASFLKLKTDNLKASTGNSSVNYFAFAFPIKPNKWGAALGLLPFSSVGYSIDQTNYNLNGVDTSSSRFIGSGRTYQAFVGTGYKIKNLSLGANLKYVFGTINNANTWELPDTLNAYNSFREESRFLNDWMVEGGLQYVVHMIDTCKKTKRVHNFELVLGLNGNLTTNIHTRRDLLYERFVYGANGFTAKDTFYISKGEIGQVVIPMQLNGGIMFREQDKFSIGVNLKYGQWSNFSSFGQKDSSLDGSNNVSVMSNSWRISVGGEWIPNDNGQAMNDGYGKLIHYRMGVYYGKNNLHLLGSDFSEKGITAGFGLPMKRLKFFEDSRFHTVSEFSISVDAGTRGTTANNLIKESYYRIYFGVSLSDLWFQKRKYD